MHVLFLAPHFPANQIEFVRALKAVGARVTGIGDVGAEHLPGAVRQYLDDYEHVPNTANAEQVTEAVRRVQRRGPWVDRLESTIEALMYAAAAAREHTGIPGLTQEQVTLCRDKFVMKQFLRARGIPCARNAVVSTLAEARAFVADVGFPVVLKPRDGAGSMSTYRIDDDGALLSAAREIGLLERPVHFTMEEFISGHEGFYDTLTVNGEVVFEGICHYYPNVLEAMRTRWISPQIVVTNRVQAPAYQELREFSGRVIRELGLGTTATHMEWFYGPRGLRFSEIGARPPGVRLWDLYCAANDMDLYVEWARGVCGLPCQPRPSRRYSAGLIALRPTAEGVVRGYVGVDEMHRKHGDAILKVHLPAVGSRAQPLGAGYMGHAWVWVRHPDYDACRAIMDDIGQTVKMIAG